MLSVSNYSCVYFSPCRETHKVIGAGQNWVNITLQNFKKNVAAPPSSLYFPHPPTPQTAHH